MHTKISKIIKKIEGDTMIIINNQQNTIEISREIISIIKKSITQSLKYENIKKKVEVSVSIVDNKEIREINSTYRKIDKETDVLSFPMVDFNIEEDDIYDYHDGHLMLGDIVLSIEKALQQSVEYRHSLEREVGFLCVHSTLHLLGYDHESQEDTKVMRLKEEEILNSLKLVRD